MTIQKTILENETVLTISGFMDTNTAPQMKDALDTLEPNTPALALDLTELEYISSAGARLLVAAHKKMNGKLTIRHVNSNVLNILHMAGLDKRLHIEA
ncbi:MAG: STAS domain-containing protein [Oscillospiraceae bacterium]|nr:STAS domain-containing protein [Oscillospiraceae bacterium]